MGAPILTPPSLPASLLTPTILPPPSYIRLYESGCYGSGYYDSRCYGFLGMGVGVGVVYGWVDFFLPWVCLRLHCTGDPPFSQARISDVLFIVDRCWYRATQVRFPRSTHDPAMYENLAIILISLSGNCVIPKYTSRTSRSVQYTTIFNTHFPNNNPQRLWRTSIKSQPAYNSEKIE